MSHVFARHSKHALPTVVGGEGCYLIDSTGKRYLDGSEGAAVSCLGHGDREVIGAIKDQLDRIAFAHTGFLISEPAETLADLLVANAPDGIKRVYLVSGGLRRPKRRSNWRVNTGSRRDMPTAAA